MVSTPGLWSLLVSLLIGCGPGRGRDLHCEAIQLGSRAEAICRATAETLKLWAFGRPIPMPGYISEHGGVRYVYCKLDIDAADAPLLDQLRTKPGVDWRVVLMAVDLLPLSQGDAKFSGSIYDPSSPDYLLKGGCSALEHTK